MHTALTIAGSDPSAGAGIQADLKTFSANGVYGQTAIVALVDENTVGVYGIHQVPTEFVKGQVRSALTDIGANAIKIGMLGDLETATAVRDVLLEFKGKAPGVDNIVLDPVMVATSGDPLLEPSAIEFLRNELVPLARIITPNVPEAEILLGRKLTAENFEQAARDLSKLGKDRPLNVFLKAGHLVPDETRILVDYFYNAEADEVIRLPSRYVDARNTHGTGCTLSSALAANLARGFDLNTTAQRSKEYITSAIEASAAAPLGRGVGPVAHFYRWY